MKLLDLILTAFLVSVQKKFKRLVEQKIWKSGQIALLFYEKSSHLKKLSFILNATFHPEVNSLLVFSDHIKAN